MTPFGVIRSERVKMSLQASNKDKEGWQAVG